jgi:hypothetical protein
MSHKSAANAIVSACFLAGLFVVSVSTGGIQDGGIDEATSPSCRIGSLQSWQGRPCVIPFETFSAGTTEGTE